jgi:predicted transcriptional regulator
MVMVTNVEGPSSTLRWPTEKTERNDKLEMRYVTDRRATVHTLAKEFGISAARVQQILKKRGVQMRSKGPVGYPRMPEATRKLAARLAVKKGLSYPKIAARIHRSPAAVGRAVRKYGAEVKMGWTTDKVSTLTDLWSDSHWSAAQIAELLEVSESAARVKAHRLGLHR